MNEIRHIDCLTGLRELGDEVIDLVVTSPPYDELRDYGKVAGWSYETFQPIAKELARTLKKGGVIVWVVNDQVINGSETGSSFKQALYFKDDLKLNLHDTMFYYKTAAGFPAGKKANRYTNRIEYMFILSKGKPKTANLIRDKKNTWANTGNWGKHKFRTRDGSYGEAGHDFLCEEYGARDHIWKIDNSAKGKTKDTKFHPATFPAELAEGHIKTWSVKDDLVLDPFCGSGTTCRVAKILGRKYLGMEINKEYADEANKLLNRILI